jgi:hypothetical protein
MGIQVEARWYRALTIKTAGKLLLRSRNDKDLDSTRESCLRQSGDHLLGCSHQSLELGA